MRPDSSSDRLLHRILSGQSDNNIRFNDLRSLLIRLGFEERINGSHHIFTKRGIPGLINLQPRSGQVKAHQAQQVRRLLKENGIGEE